MIWPRFAAAEATLMKALSLAPEHASAHLCLGGVQIQTNRAAQGIAECERALALDRNLARAHGLIGMAKLLVGRAEETEAHIKEALRLSPRDTICAMRGWPSRGTPSCFSGKTRRQSGCCRRAIETKSELSECALLARCQPCASGSAQMKRALQPKPGLRLTQPSRSHRLRARRCERQSDLSIPARASL